MCKSNNYGTFPTRSEIKCPGNRSRDTYLAEESLCFHLPSTLRNMDEARHNLYEILRENISRPPALPHQAPTASAWQSPPSSIADAQSSVLPGETDVVIIGSGITGCSVAKSLLDGSTLRVVVLEARQAVSGATGRNGGHLISDAASLISRQPLDGQDARDVLRFSEKNINSLKRLVADMDGDSQEYIGLQDVTATAVFADAEGFDHAAKQNATSHDSYPESTIRNSTLSTTTAAEVRCPF